MLTTVPVSSVSLTGLPSPNWTHLWRELLLSPWWRGVDLAGLLGMTTMPPLTEPTVELESGRTSSWSSGTMLWRPTIGLDEDGVDWTKTEPSSPDQRSHEYQHAEKSVQISGSYVRIGHPVLMNWLDLYTHFRQGRHCETSSVELHPKELEDLTWCEVGLLEVDDPVKKLEDLDGCLGVQLSLFRCICPNQPVV